VRLGQKKCLILVEKKKMFRLENLLLLEHELRALEKASEQLLYDVDIDIEELKIDGIYFSVSINFGDLEVLFRLAMMAGINTQIRNSID